MHTEPCQHCKGTGKQLNQRAVGAEMRGLRELAQVSLREMARRMGITPPYLSDMELGKRNWSLERLEAFRKSLKK